jgi:hypothetical protein
LLRIRAYNPEKDLGMIQSWCAAYNEMAPTEETIPTSSSYVLEMEGTPSLFISLVKTNAKYCYLENYCGNPEFKGLRAEAVQTLISHLESEAKASGYSILATFAYKPKLIPVFENYGFTRTVELTAFSRRIA